MKNISTGAGLVVLGLGVALHPLVSGLVAQATAAPSSPSASAAAAVASAATAQAGPTVVWMGVTPLGTFADVYHRLWSDGKLERRHVYFTLGGLTSTCTYERTQCRDTDWVEVPPPPGGNGFACRTDINGDGLVGSSDLSLLLNDWGQEGRCEPNYPCLDLGNLAGGVPFK